MVPPKERWWCDEPVWNVGATSTSIFGRARSAAARATCSTIRKSVPRGRCGPCCSVAPTGKTTSAPGARRAASPRVISCSRNRGDSEGEGVIGTGRSDSQRRQELAVAAGALLGSTHAGEDILLDYRPTIVAVLIQPAHDPGEVDPTLAELGENAGPQRLEVVPSLVARAPRQVAVIVLEMDVPDAIGPAVQRLDH